MFCLQTICQQKKGQEREERGEAEEEEKDDSVRVSYMYNAKSHVILLSKRFYARTKVYALTVANLLTKVNFDNWMTDRE